MSIAATNWAYRQKIPIKPKFVLAALADQTDERTGRVCYGKTDMAYLADKCSIPERSLYRYLGALIRNDYLIRESGKALGQASVYWLRLDRELAVSLSEWQWKSTEDLEEDEPQDIAVGSAILAEGEVVENLPADPKMAEGVCHAMAVGVRHKVADQESTEERKNANARKCAKNNFGFLRKEQDIEREDLAIKAAAQKAAAKFFVIEDSRAWRAWCDYRRAHGLPGSLPTCNGQGEHVNRRGWWMPSLFPPTTESSDSPKNFTDKDIDDFK